MRGVAPGRVVVNPLAPSGWGVYLVTDRAQTGGRALIDVVGAALQGGIRAVQLRERDMSARELLALAVRLRESTRAAGAALLINDRVDVALACDADGVHLPAGSDPAASRALLGPDKLIGVSLHTVTEAEAIDRSVVDYAIAGPAFETPSKPGYGPEIGHKGLAEIARAAPVPVLAIGGLNATRAAEVLAAGPRGIAVMGSIMRAVDPGQEVRALLAIVAGAHPRAR